MAINQPEQPGLVINNDTGDAEIWMLKNMMTGEMELVGFFSHKKYGGFAGQLLKTEYERYWVHDYRPAEYRGYIH